MWGMGLSDFVPEAIGEACGGIVVHTARIDTAQECLGHRRILRHNAVRVAIECRSHGSSQTLLSAILRDRVRAARGGGGGRG